MKSKSIKRMCPTAPRDIINKSINELTAVQISPLKLLNTDEHIPLYSAFVNEIIANKDRLKKPIKVELKKLLSWDAKVDVITLTEKLRDGVNFPVSLIMFKKKWKRYFTKRERDVFLAMLEDREIKMEWL